MLSATVSNRPETEVGGGGSFTEEQNEHWIKDNMPQRTASLLPTEEVVLECLWGNVLCSLV